MDIGALSSALANAKTLSAVGVAMLDKTMDMQEVAGAGIVGMIDAAAMEQSVNPHIGGNFDMRI